MTLLAPLARLVSPAKPRLLDAERLFFDAYSRGGSHDPRDLVVPIDYFVRPDVARALEAWADGREDLDERALERAWRAEAGVDDAADASRFYRNLAHFLSLVRRPLVAA